MQLSNELAKIGKTAARCAFGLLALAAISTPVNAATKVQFTAEVDRSEISLEESVSLKFNVRAEGSGSIEEPQFRAADFDLVNQFTSVFVESFYENGRFGMRNNRSITKVLRPSRQGDLRISDISIVVDGKPYKAPDILVKVGPPGSGTPPPKGYGGAGVGLRGAGKKTPLRNVMLRAELDKEDVYKGQQLVVSYYIYSRVRFFNLAVEKYPGLSGFLKEELEMPVTVANGRLQAERVIVDGVPYNRALLARYAAYPLQSGQLTIDPLAVKYSYYPNQGDDAFDGDDPFLNFFQQMAPRASSDRSDSLKIKVNPLPEEGRPSSFTGGVGDFQVTSAVDKYDLRANEAVLLTVKIEGKGNVAAIAEPKAAWPKDVELYESKGQAKPGPGGVGQKIFEYLLIPRAPGTVTLPALEFSFFDPSQRQYVTRKTDPVQLNVQPGAPGTSTGGPARAPISAANPKAAPNAEPRGLKPMLITTQENLPIWRWFYWGALACLGILAVLILGDLAKRGKATAEAFMQSKAKAQSRSWDRLSAMAKAAKDGAPWREVLEAYDLLASIVLDTLEKRYPVGVRSFSRSELEQLLTERGMNVQTWKRAASLLEYSELVRFASSAGAVSEQSARQELENWVKEGKGLTQIIEA